MSLSPGEGKNNWRMLVSVVHHIMNNNLLLYICKFIEQCGCIWISQANVLLLNRTRFLNFLLKKIIIFSCLPKISNAIFHAAFNSSRANILPYKSYAKLHAIYIIVPRALKNSYSFLRKTMKVGVVQWQQRIVYLLCIAKLIQYHEFTCHRLYDGTNDTAKLFSQIVSTQSNYLLI